ncbi:hypothetical protein [Microbispora sp. NPDC049633]|uniref:hypothetical protein n=1 Tax=Microbispora sp. NPDC049633 TaxID=3154355 RepID=UPI003426C603
MRKLRMTPELLQVLRDGCSDFNPDLAFATHTKTCVACTRTLLEQPGRFRAESLELLVDRDRLMASLDLPTGRFTTFGPCPSCGGEIYGSQIERKLVWANRLDGLPHNCADFRDRPVEVEAWRPSRSRQSKRRGGRVKRVNE